MIVHPQVDPPAAPAESALLGVPNWLVPTVGKAITAATVVAMFYLQAAQSRDERLGLAHSDQLGPPNKLREILSLAGRPPPDLHEAIAALMGDPRPNQTAAAPSSSIDLRDLLAQVQALLGGAIAPGAGAGAPAAPTPPTVAGAAGGSSPSAAASWPSMPWHAPASAPPSPTPPPASATPPAANTRPPTRLPAGFVSTDHLPRYRPEFTREGSIKRLAAAAPPTTPTSPTASPRCAA